MTGDIVFTTNNKIMVDNSFGGNPITYQKKPTEKKFIDTKDLYKADLLSFDSKIGYITNCSTTLYGMLPLFEKDSKEYNTIMHRLKECRVAQGNEIDKAKGLIVKDFPKHWTEWQNPNKPNEQFTKEEIELNNKLLIEKRPYFMRYLYPKYNQEYQLHNKKYEYLCYRLFGIHIEELLSLKNKTEEQQKLADNYNKFNPLLETNCVMNNICRYMEKEVKEIKVNIKKASPDYIFNILYNPKKSITETEIEEMDKVYKKYIKSQSSKRVIQIPDSEEIIKPPEEITMNKLGYISEDIQKLANLAVYVNYVKYPNANKNFCWKIFSDGIMFNIYDNSRNKFTIPLEDSEGDIKYMGSKYKNKEVKLNLDCV